MFSIYQPPRGWDDGGREEDFSMSCTVPGGPTKDKVGDPHKMAVLRELVSLSLSLSYSLAFSISLLGASLRNERGPMIQVNLLRSVSLSVPLYMGMGWAW